MAHIVITGAAGLVGQNLIPRLKAAGYTQIVGIDKSVVNCAILAAGHPDLTVIVADLAVPMAGSITSTGQRRWSDRWAGSGRVYP